MRRQCCYFQLLYKSVLKSFVYIVRDFHQHNCTGYVAESCDYFYINYNSVMPKRAHLSFFSFNIELCSCHLEQQGFENDFCDRCTETPVI